MLRQFALHHSGDFEHRGMTMTTVFKPLALFIGAHSLFLGIIVALYSV